MRLNTFYGAIALVAGTSIGAAILSLPVSTAAYGFVPAVLLMLVCWWFMTYSALLLFEVNSGCEPSSNLISMARKTLGWPGVVLTWSSYLLLLYALMVAYLSGLSAILVDVAQKAFGHHMAVGSAVVFLVSAFGALIYAGTRFLDIMNRVLMAVLVCSFIVILGTILWHGSMHHVLSYTDHHVWHASGMVITSFGFAIIVPSLRRYCGATALQLLPKAIVWGSLIPLFAYIAWEAVMLAEIPVHGPFSFSHILSTGQPATGLVHVLTLLLRLPWFGVVLQVFMLVIITTSLVGVALSLFDCLRDGCRFPVSRVGRLLAVLLTMVPPAVFSVWYPAAFMPALQYASFFVAILLGLLPTCMVWRTRCMACDHVDQQPNAQAVYRAPGGSWVLGLNAVFFLAVICVDIVMLVT